MKIFPATVFFFSAICHAFDAVYRLDSYFPNEPENGYNNITLPFAIGYTPNATGYMMAYAFTYADSFLAMISLLPYEKDGKASLRVAALSVGYENAFYDADSTCHGVEEDSIVCWNEIPFAYGEPHLVIVANTDPTRWEVAVAYEEDDVWETEHVGGWRTQARGGINGPVNGTLKYFNEGFDVSEDCSKLPEDFMYHGRPLGDDTKGTFRDPVLNLTCDGVPFNATRVSDGIFIDVGFEKKGHKNDPKDL